jgi:hypothetical protein
MIGTPKTRWPVNPIARGTELTSTNSTYAIPLERREFLSEIILTSRTYKENKHLTTVACAVIHCKPQQHYYFKYNKYSKDAKEKTKDVF